MPTTARLDRPEGHISYEDYGGDGPLVVAAPGMGDTRRVYRHLGPRLTEAALRLVTMDLRGMGDSSVGWDDLSDAAVASDYLALVDHLETGQAVLVGNSLSCASAVIAAVAAPEKIAGLVLIGPFVRDVPQKWWQPAAFRLMLAPLWGQQAWIAYYRKNLYPGPKPPDHDEYVARLAENLAEPGRFADFRAMTSNSHAESGRRIMQVSQPTLVVMGTADPDFPDPAAEANHLGTVMGADVLFVEGSGHYPQADNPEQVAPGVIALVEKSRA